MITAERINTLSAEQKEYVIALRRHFHENPEVSMQEFNTSKRVEAELTSMGVSYVKTSATGIVAKIGNGNGKKVLLRADMDALPMEEDTENLNCKKNCVSKVEGVNHACGHDGHTAMLLGAAKVLKSIENEIDGTIFLAFEDGEEVSIGDRFNENEGVGGILHYLKDEDIDSCYGIHLYAAIPSGKICVDAGPRMAGICRFEAELTGKGGHGSRPDEAISPLFAAAYTMTNLANSWVNEIDVTKTVTLGMGYLNAGSKFNIIPNTATFGGSLRFFDMEEGKKGAAAVERITKLSAEMHRCQLTSFSMDFMSSVINDEGCSEIAKEVVTELCGADALYSCPPWFGSESFNHYLRRWKGVLAHVGIANPDKGIGALHHNPKFDIDEDVLPVGVATMVGYAMKVLS